MTTATTTLKDETSALRVQDVLMYVGAGIIFGIILTKSEVISWFRIQEMFRFQSFHMYGVMGSAVAVGMLATALIKRFNIKDIHGEPIQVEEKSYEHGYNQWIGGLIFGLGWALTGACPGPLYALIGNGAYVISVTLLCAAAGALAYGFLKPKLPH